MSNRQKSTVSACYKFVCSTKLALVKKEVTKFFERGIVKDYVVPLIDEVTKDVLNGQPPDLLDAAGTILGDRIWDKVVGGPKKLLSLLDKSMRQALYHVNVV